MNNKILLTGACGYIGSVLVPYLEKNGYNCLIADTGFFKDCYLYKAEQKAEVLWKDVRKLDLSILDNYSAVVHLAGISNDPFGNLNPSEVYDPTREYSKVIAQACKNRGIKFIFASSCSIYGKANQDIVDENSEPNPQTPYSLNKLQIEQDLLEMSDKNFAPIMLRFATIYGMSPRFRLDLVINMLTAMSLTHGKIVLNSDGKAWRPHLHILDACQAVLVALKQTINSALIVNVGRDEENFTILEVAKIISKASDNCPIEFLNSSQNTDQNFTEIVKDRKVPKGVDSRSYKVSFAKIKEKLPDFKANWTLERGVEEIRSILLKMNFTRSDFENRKYYRLQKIEDLFSAGKLTSELFWKD